MLIRTMENKISREELKELRDEILKAEPTPQIETKKLIFDGRQYSLKIPKKFIEEAGIDYKKNEFEICLLLPSPSTDEKPQLNIKLKR